MELLSALYKKYQYETRFVIVGLINTAVGYGIFAFFLWLRIPYQLATVLSMIVGTTNSYFWNKYFTFKSSKKSFWEVVRFVSVYAVQLLVNEAMLMLLIEVFGVNKYIAGIPTLFVTTLVSFFGHKFFSFREVIKNQGL